jgi:hypothetical protein
MAEISLCVCSGEGGIKKLVNVVRLRLKPGGIMNYAIFMVVTALCAYGLNFLTSKIGAGASHNNQGDGREGRPYGVSFHLFCFLWLYSYPSNRQ